VARTKFAFTAFCVSCALGSALHTPLASADNCVYPTVSLLQVTGEEDMSAFDHVAFVAGSVGQSTSAWESSRHERTQLAAKAARVANFAPVEAPKVTTPAATAQVPVRDASQNLSEAVSRPTTSVEIRSIKPSRRVPRILAPRIKKIR